jgi:hypothetical protein
MSVTDRNAEGDHFLREWATFDRIWRGEPVGLRADGTPVPAPGDGFIIFPNPRAQVETEWFYFAVESDRRLAALA